MGNVCNCETPPGGQAICEPNQLAICRVKNGVAQMQCLNPPTTVAIQNLTEWKLQMANWVLSIITSSDRSETTAVTPTDWQLLASGRSEDSSTGEVVTFSLPEELRSVLTLRAQERAQAV